MKGHAVTSSQINGHATCRTIGHDRPASLFKYMIQTKCQREFFTEVSSRGIDQCKAIGIWVLAKTDCSMLLQDSAADVLEIIFGRFRRMRKITSGRFTQNLNLAAKSFQQASSE